MTNEETAQFLEKARQHFRWEPETGRLFWIKSSSNKGPVGRQVGTVDKNGYRCTTLHGKCVKVHRLIWLMAHGEWPKHHIDHINGDPSDNRLENLRDVPAKVNCQNKRKPRKGNRLGVMGVYFRAGAYTAQITVDNKMHYLGRYKTPEEAHEVYMTARRQLHEGNTL